MINSTMSLSSQGPITMAMVVSCNLNGRLIHNHPTLMTTSSCQLYMGLSMVGTAIRGIMNLVLIVRTVAPLAFHRHFPGLY